MTGEPDLDASRRLRPGIELWGRLKPGIEANEADADEAGGKLKQGSMSRGWKA